MSTPEHIRKVMQGNRAQNTRPEIIVRQLLTSLGYRYRLHARDLPGRPDVVFRSRRKAILVHGCFWHQHESPTCSLRSHPRSNVAYWAPKLAGNKRRDAQVLVQLAQEGWSTLLIWECEIADTKMLTSKLKRFFGKPKVI